MKSVADTSRLVAMIMVVLAAVIAFRPLRDRFDGVFPAPRESVLHDTATATFVGAQRCASCHVAQYDAWAGSTHGRAGGTPSPTLVIAPFDGVPIRFANAVVFPRRRGTDYEFEVRPDQDAPVVLRVNGVVGAGRIYGGGTQAYFTDRADGSWRMLPFEWSRQGRAWFCNTNPRSGAGWTAINASMRLEDCGDWPPSRALGEHPRLANCQSCHASQAVVRLDSAAGAHTTRFTSLAINCESCHGPGGRHVAFAEQGRLGADIGYASLTTLDKDASLGVCYQCHAVKTPLRRGFVSGDSLSAFYSIALAALGDRPLHPDGRIRTFAYQEGHLFSDCYLNGGMTCVSCHDPHGQQYRSVTGEALRGRFDDAQCTSCHVSKADRVVEHTRHTSRTVSCVSCHMPSRQEPETRPGDLRLAGRRVVPFARSDHTISIPRPALDSALALPNACATCHATMTTEQAGAQIRAWWGTTKPLPAAVTAQQEVTPRMPIEQAGPLLLGESGDQASTLARFAGVSRYIETYSRLDATLPPDAERRLRELATAPDVDVRAAALAALDVAQGGRRATRRVLAAALRHAGDRDAALRERWALVLGFLGDRYATDGHTYEAIATYGRALRVLPSSAQLHLNLGNAQRAAGDPNAAIASYQRSLALDRQAPLTWVNLGLALSDRGDADGAASTLRRAIAIDSAELLGWYNLATLSFARGDIAQARTELERAAELDPSVPEVQFLLARAALLGGDTAAAVTHLRRGLAFDSSDAVARAAYRELRSRQK